MTVGLAQTGSLCHDPFGKHGRTSPFVGAIRQFIAKVDNRNLSGNGPGIGFNRDYGAPTSHSPN